MSERQVLIENVQKLTQLPENFPWQELKEIFRSAGHVLRADVHKQGRAGSVLFSSAEEAQEAVRMFNGSEVAGEIISVFIKQSVNAAPGTNETSLYVGNIPFRATVAELTDIFSTAGNVEFADIPLTHHGRSKGFGVVVMATSTEALKAKGALVY